MPFFSRVPLAWLNLTRDPRRFVVALSGISFAVILMFMQVGFLNGLFDSNLALIRKLNGQLVIISTSKDALAVSNPFPQRRLEEARGVAGVAGAYPLYMERVSSLWKDPQAREADNRRSRPIRVLAFNPDDPVLDIAALELHLDQLRKVDSALYDVQSKKVYERTQGKTLELAGRKLSLVGQFSLGTDFVNNGTLIMSAENYARFFPPRGSQPSVLALVEIGVIQLNDKANVARVQAALKQRLPGDVCVLTREQYEAKEKKLWETSSPVAFIFYLGTVIGFIVGTVICYQILSSDIADHLAEFATLKAIGYPNSYLTGVVLQEALFLSLLGFLPGLVVSAVLYALLGSWTGLPMDIRLNRSAVILALTVSMCIISGLWAVRKVQAADPAEVF